MTQTVESALAQATFYNDGQNYALVKLPTKAITAAAGVLAEIGEPFAALIVDKDETTLIVEEEGFEELAVRLPGHILSPIFYRLITIDVELAPELTGFMARIGTALAGAGVTILPLAAYSRDHLLVPAAQFDSALQALEALKSSVM
ncbi:MAG: ACT domain-containing protein [Chitinophagaceae bacterium]|nr:ACT domain-containing protein [Anaerolineae bacterium]